MATTLEQLAPVHVPPGCGGVYFVYGANLVKIGWARDIPSRMAALQTGSPISLTLVAVHQTDARRTESDYHLRFSHLRAHGEWFRASDELLAEIQTLRGQSLSSPEGVDELQSCPLAADVTRAHYIARRRIGWSHERAATTPVGRATGAAAAIRAFGPALVCRQVVSARLRAGWEPKAAVLTPPAAPAPPTSFTRKARANRSNRKNKLQRIAAGDL